MKTQTNMPEAEDGCFPVTCLFGIIINCQASGVISDLNQAVIKINGKLHPDSAGFFAPSFPFHTYVHTQQIYNRGRNLLT